MQLAVTFADMATKRIEQTKDIKRTIDVSDAEYTEDEQ
jgi:hypothetical protein